MKKGAKNFQIFLMIYKLLEKQNTTIKMFSYHPPLKLLVTSTILDIGNKWYKFR